MRTEKPKANKKLNKFIDKIVEKIGILTDKSEYYGRDEKADCPSQTLDDDTLSAVKNYLCPICSCFCESDDDNTDKYISGEPVVADRDL